VAREALLSVDDLGTMFSTFTKSAFRLETLPEYRVLEEQAELERYLAGEPLPDVGELAPWLELLKSSTDAGKIVERVRVVPEPLTPYVRFEIEWGYLYNAEGGERIGVIPDLAFSALDVSTHGDFWLFDDEVVFAMHYDEHGVWLGATREPAEDVERYRNTRDLAKLGGISLGEYLARVRGDASSSPAR